MGDVALRGPDVKKFVKLAKKRDLNFAYCPGNDPKEDVFVLDRKKNPEVIGRAARAEGTGTKAAIGTARVKGRVMMMTCLKELPQMAKKLKKLLKFEKVPMNIIIMDKDGNILEEDIEDLPVDPELDGNDEDDGENTGQAGDGDGNNGQDDPRLKQLKARAVALNAAIAGLDQKKQGPLGKALKGVLAAMKAGQLDSAEMALTKLEAGVSKMSGLKSTTPTANGDKDADLSHLSQEAAALKVRIDALGGADGVTRLLGVHGLLSNQIKAGNVKKATVSVKALADAVAKVEAQAGDANVPADNQKQNEGADANLEAEWRTARAELEPVARDLAQRGMGDVKKLTLVVNHLTEKGAAGDFKNALKAVPGLKKLIAAAQAAAQSEAETAIPAGVAHYNKARLDWRETRSTLTSEMSRLEKAIIDTCDASEFPNAARDASRLFDYLAKLDDRLENALEALEQEQDGDAREKLKGPATAVLAEFKRELDTDFFKAVDGNNGFTPVNVRGAAITSLRKVEDALSQAAA